VQAYENMKKKAKKGASDDKVKRLCTGGGMFEVKVDVMAEKLLAALGNWAKATA